MKVIIVGGVAGGASTAARLRRINEQCEIMLIERGEYISFANCGLPYYIGDVITNKRKLVLQTPEALKRRFNIDVRVLNEVISIDIHKKQVEIHDIKNDRKYIESYDKLVLSPGAYPIKPNIKGMDGSNVFTLRNIPDTYAIKDYIEKKKPKKAIVAGGGYIGVEIAENLHDIGIDVTIIELANQIIGPLDYEMACLIQLYLKEKGVKFKTGDMIKSINHTGKDSFVELDSGVNIETDMIVMGIGVRPEVQIAKNAGLEIGERGGIRVDSTLKTSDVDIYAVGDAIEVVDYVNKNFTLIPLAGPANKQGRIAANNIGGIKDEYKGTQGTSVLKVFDMTVATTGNNEKILELCNIPYKKSFTHSLSHASYYPGAASIALKVLFSPADGKVLGAQAIGYEGVEKRIDVIATAIRAGMTVYDLQELELSYAPPYSSAKDPVNIAGFVAGNIVNGDINVAHWNDIANISKDKTILLDVRTQEEFNMGTIEGSINIPIDDLRERINELPKDKEIIAFCRIGFRAYLACKILTQNSFENVKNLSGGYTTYFPTTQF